jgi:hypothetical protein
MSRKYVRLGGLSPAPVVMGFRHVRWREVHGYRTAKPLSHVIIGAVCYCYLVAYDISQPRELYT